MRRSPQRQQTIKVIVETQATTQVGRPDIDADTLRGAQVESAKKRAKL